MEAVPAVFGEVENNIFEGSLLVIVTGVSVVVEAGAEILTDTAFCSPCPRVATKPVITGVVTVAAKLPPMVGVVKPFGVGMLTVVVPVLTATKLGGLPPVILPPITTMGVRPVSEPPATERLLELIVPIEVKLLDTGTDTVKPPRTC